MTAYKATNRGVDPIGVYTLAGDSAVAETLAPGATSADTVEAFHFPEARNAYINHGNQSNELHSIRTFNAGKVLIAELGTAPTDDFAFDSWKVNLVGLNTNTPVSF